MSSYEDASWFYLVINNHIQKYYNKKVLNFHLESANMQYINVFC